MDGTMSFGSSLVLYLTVGAGVAAALFLRGESVGARGALQLGIAWLFWPLYVPVLLATRSKADRETLFEAPGAEPATTDPIDREIARVEAELDRALRMLDGWAEATLSGEGVPFEELRHAWRVQAERIRELSGLLAATAAEPSRESVAPSADRPSPGVSSRVQQSEGARRENLQRLRGLRDRMQEDLLGNLAWVRELVTQIYLAKYTGAPASRAEDLVSQIAAAVDGLSRVSDWHAEPPAARTAKPATAVTTAAD
jgi:hypothetical protein